MFGGHIHGIQDSSHAAQRIRFLLHEICGVGVAGAKANHGAYGLNDNGLSKLIVNVVAPVLDGYDTAALQVANYGNGFTTVTAE